MIWDPFLASAQTAINARVIQDGKDTVNNYQFYLSDKNYATKHPAVINALFEEIGKVDQWAKTEPKVLAQALVPLTKLDQSALELSIGRAGYGVNYITADVVVHQQKIADTFHDLGLIPKHIDVKDVIWKPDAQ